MGPKERISNKIEEARGRGKEAIGAITGNRDLKSEGKSDQVKARAKNAGEDVKDALNKVKDPVTE
jgi:uncharacterized protein YjbJ (UPF0337 family)